MPMSLPSRSRYNWIGPRHSSDFSVWEDAQLFRSRGLTLPLVVCIRHCLTEAARIPAFKLPRYFLVLIAAWALTRCLPLSLPMKRVITNYLRRHHYLRCTPLSSLSCRAWVCAVYVFVCICFHLRVMCTYICIYIYIYICVCICIHVCTVVLYINVYVIQVG